MWRFCWFNLPKCMNECALLQNICNYSNAWGILDSNLHISCWPRNFNVNNDFYVFASLFREYKRYFFLFLPFNIVIEERHVLGISVRFHHRSYNALRGIGNLTSHHNYSWWDCISDCWNYTPLRTFYRWYVIWLTTDGVPALITFYMQCQKYPDCSLDWACALHLIRMIFFIRMYGEFLRKFACDLIIQFRYVPRI